LKKFTVTENLIQDAVDKVVHSIKLHIGEIVLGVIHSGISVERLLTPDGKKMMLDTLLGITMVLDTTELCPPNQQYHVSSKLKEELLTEILDELKESTKFSRKHDQKRK